eukprot:1161925-Pelagomonas_calceolata.AAC.16
MHTGPKEQQAGKGKQKQQQQQQQPQKQQQQQEHFSQQQQAADHAWQSRVLCAAQEKSVEEIVRWVGPGAPLPPADPAAIFCFLSIPGKQHASLQSGTTDCLSPLLWVQLKECPSACFVSIPQASGACFGILQACLVGLG